MRWEIMSEYKKEKEKELQIKIVSKMKERSVCVLKKQHNGWEERKKPRVSL